MQISQTCVPGSAESLSQYSSRVDVPLGAKTPDILHMQQANEACAQVNTNSV